MYELHSLSRQFGTSYGLKDITLCLPDRGVVLIKGENGSGKSTLLNLLGLMDDQYSGSLLFQGKEIRHMSSGEKNDIRRNEISYLFQSGNFISFLNDQQNSFLPDYLSSRHSLSSFSGKPGKEMSEGEKALCWLKRGLVPGKKVYLLDEVTASLDDQNTEKILQEITALGKNSLIVFVSHDLRAEKAADFSLLLEKGSLRQSTLPPQEESRHQTPAISEKRKQRKYPALFFREQRSALSLLSLALAFFAYLVCWFPVMSLTYDASSLLEKEMLPGDILSVQETDQKQILQDFPEESFPGTETILYSSLLPDDGKIYLSSDLAEKDLSDGKTALDVTLAGSAVFSLPVQEDSSLSIPLPSAHPNLLDHLSVSEMKDPYSLRYAQWKTETINVDDPAVVRAYSNTVYSFYSPSLFEKESGIAVKESLAEDSFFVSPSQIQLLSEKNTHFISAEEMNPSVSSDFEDLNEVFPEGVQVLPASSEEGQYLGKNRILVSDSTLRKIVLGFPSSDRVYLSITENNRIRISDYLFSHSLNAHLAFRNQKKSEENPFSDYNRIVSQKSRSFSFSFIGLFLAPLFSFFVFGLAYWLFLKKNQKNHRDLFSLGISEAHLFFGSSVFYSVFYFFAVFGGYFASMLMWGVTQNNMFGFFPAVSLGGILWCFLSFALFEFLLWILFRTRKIT
jgi:putative ABC transport system ATP-binding protein